MCTLHMPYRTGEMRPLMQFAEASAVICTPSGDKYNAPATMLGLVGEVPTLKHVIVAYGETPKGCLSMENMMEEASEAPISGRFSASDPCLLCFTSGTSASPKA